MDFVSKLKRSSMMRQVGQKNTKPEIAVECVTKYVTNSLKLAVTSYNEGLIVHRL
jgi:G:T-mismatch repair DNA endonuclease (very short patch repair protein)